MYHGYEDCMGLPTSLPNYTCKIKPEIIAEFILNELNESANALSSEEQEAFFQEAKTLATTYGQDTIEHLQGFLDNFSDDPTFTLKAEYEKTIEQLLKLRQILVEKLKGNQL